MKFSSHSTIICCFFLIASQGIFAQNPEGLWKNIDEDGQAKSIIRISIDEGILSARVVEFLPVATIKHCLKCEGKEEGISLLDINLLDGLVKQGNSWRGGTILNPKSGKKYKALISFKNDNILNVRGYIGKPIFGKTYQWIRVTDSEENTQ